VPNERGDEDIEILATIPFEDDRHHTAELCRAVLDEPREPEASGALCPDNFVRIRRLDADGLTDELTEIDLLDEKVSPHRIDAAKSIRKQCNHSRMQMTLVAVNHRFTRLQHTDAAHRLSSLLYFLVIPELSPQVLAINNYEEISGDKRWLISFLQPISL